MDQNLRYKPGAKELPSKVCQSFPGRESSVAPNFIKVILCPALCLSIDFMLSIFTQSGELDHYVHSSCQCFSKV